MWRAGIPFADEDGELGRVLLSTDGLRWRFQVSHSVLDQVLGRTLENGALLSSGFQSFCVDKTNTRDSDKERFSGHEWR